METVAGRDARVVIRIMVVSTVACVVGIMVGGEGGCADAGTGPLPGLAAYLTGSIFPVLHEAETVM